MFSSSAFANDGRYTFSDGSWFEGIFVNGNPSEGIIHCADGKKSTGKFVLRGNTLKQVEAYDIRVKTTDENGRVTTKIVRNSDRSVVGQSEKSNSGSGMAALGGVAALGAVGVAGAVVAVGLAAAAAAAVASPEIMFLLLIPKWTDTLKNAAFKGCIFYNFINYLLFLFSHPYWVSLSYIPPYKRCSYLKILHCTQSSLVCASWYIWLKPFHYYALVISYPSLQWFLYTE